MVEQEVVDCLNDIIIIVEKKERRRLTQKKYREKNKEKTKLYHKQYIQTEQGIKVKRINRWKRSGVICNDWDELYNQYLRTAYCDHCKVKMTYDFPNISTTKCLDHCHITGEVRNILCLSCNIKRGQSKF